MNASLIFQKFLWDKDIGGGNMRVLFISIALRPEHKKRIFPVGLSYVASSTKRAGYEVDILDLNAHYRSEDEVADFISKGQYDVIGMGCIVTGYHFVKAYCSIIKEVSPKTVIVVGNSVASSIPEILLSRTKADIAVFGEGDETFPDLLDAISSGRDLSVVPGIAFMKDGRLIRTPDRPLIKDIDSIPHPLWDIFDMEFYIDNLSQNVNDPLPPIDRDKIRAFSINTARGCPFRCTFCYQVFLGKKYRWRSPQSIIEEMRILNSTYGINRFGFADELTFFSAKQANEFANALIDSGLKVYYGADCRSGIFFKDEHLEVARNLKESGCLSLSYSLENASLEILKWMNKKTTPEQFSRQREILDQAGIPTLTSLVFGYPNETRETIEMTLQCCLENGIYPSAGYLLPQPGTPMYEYAIQHGFIRDEEEYLMAMGDRQDLRLNMTSMTDEELESYVKEGLKKINDKLKIGLSSGQLIKTGHYRSPKRL
jgi:anaerobic magnesium-protoporphyrin IX monomethyl ester cyclase